MRHPRVQPEKLSWKFVAGMGKLHGTEPIKQPGKVAGQVGKVSSA